MMNANERYLKITKLLKKFENGEKLYKESPMFYQCIQMMIEGVDVYEILEQIIQAYEWTQKAVARHLV